MTLTAILLLLLSAGMHAGWNVVAKRQHPSGSFFLLSNTAGMIMLLPVAVLHWEQVAAIPAPVWRILAATGLAMGVYYAALAGAYRHGHMSVAYPIARSLPVIVVLMVTVVRGRADEVSWLCIGGIVLVVAGGFLLPMKRLGDLRLRNYLNPSSLLAVLAAAGTAGYSMLDDEGLRTLREMPAETFTAATAAVVYLFFEAASASLWLALFVLSRRDGRAGLAAGLRTGKRTALMMGAGIHSTYLLVLISLAFVSNVSYVVAFRQLSVPLGAMLGVLILKEPARPLKFIGVAVMFAGLLLVATG